MANHKSAEKRNRQNVKRSLRNRSIRSSMRTVISEFRSAVKNGSEKKEEIFKKTVSIISKTASKGVLHKRTAARKISRLAKLAGSKK